MAGTTREPQAQVHGLDAGARGAQRRNDGLEAPALCDLGQCDGQPLHSLLGGLSGELAFRHGAIGSPS